MSEEEFGSDGSYGLGTIIHVKAREDAAPNSFASRRRR
jgi:hypothetical protein